MDAHFGANTAARILRAARILVRVSRPFLGQPMIPSGRSARPTPPSWTTWSCRLRRRRPFGLRSSAAVAALAVHRLVDARDIRASLRARRRARPRDRCQ